MRRTAGGRAASRAARGTTGAADALASSSGASASRGTRGAGANCANADVSGATVVRQQDVAARNPSDAQQPCSSVASLALAMTGHGQSNASPVTMATSCAMPTTLRSAFMSNMRTRNAPFRQKQTCYDPRRFPMASVLICAAAGPVADDLHASPVWRNGVERHKADSIQAALTMSVAAKPVLVVIDRDLPKSERLVQELRGNAATSGCSIVIVATGDSQHSEVALLEAGANAVLRHPPGPEWEERLGRLLSVPARRNLRMLVDLELDGFFGTEHHQGRVQNISRTGMMVEVPLQAGIGDQLRFKLYLSMDMSISGVARIVRLAGANRYGCEFAEMGAWDARRLEHFLETAPAS